jgi:hypothetical protein
LIIIFMGMVVGIMFLAGAFDTMATAISRRYVNGAPRPLYVRTPLDDMNEMAGKILEFKDVILSTSYSLEEPMSLLRMAIGTAVTVYLAMANVFNPGKLVGSLLNSARKKEDQLGDPHVPCYFTPWSGGLALNLLACLVMRNYIKILVMIPGFLAGAALCYYEGYIWRGKGSIAATKGRADRTITTGSSLRTFRELLVMVSSLLCVLGFEDQIYKLVWGIALIFVWKIGDQRLMCAHLFLMTLEWGLLAGCAAQNSLTSEIKESAIPAGVETGENSETSFDRWRKNLERD